MKNILFIPPIAFAIYFGIACLISKLSSMAAAKGRNLPGKEKAYACGEDVSGSKVQPDYSEFFPFAFFFTIMHVTVLVLSTVPPNIIMLPVVYLIAAAVSIFILFRR